MPYFFRKNFYFFLKRVKLDKCPALGRIFALNASSSMCNLYHLRFFFLLSFGGSFCQSSAQSGCPDPQALNYSSTATANDGSCLYPVTNYAPVVKATLPNDLQEISGLHFAGGRWWGHNDGGNPTVFYRLLPETATIAQKISLQNTDNKDWEDLTSDGAHLYIGDFGNNYNDRQDLGIYRLPLSVVGATANEEVTGNEWTFLPFHYTDQTDFTTQPEASTEFDCEAMIFLNGNPHLFSKNRKQHSTTHYLVNTATGAAEPLETLNTQGFITSASLSPDGKLVVLLGYELSGVPKIFCWLLWDWHDGLLFNGNKRRLELGNVFSLGQAEAIGFGTNRTGYVANERVTTNGITIAAQRTYAFDFSPWVPESVATKTPEILESPVFPNPFSQTVHLPVLDDNQPGLLRVTNAQGRVMLQTTAWPRTLHTATWPSGWYVFSWITPVRTVVMRGLKQ